MVPRSLTELSTVRRSHCDEARNSIKRFCTLMSLMRRFTAVATVLNGLESDRPTVTNAHAVAPSSCPLKSCTCRTASIASAFNSIVSDDTEVANAQTMWVRS
eukprot:gnl/TRDRNA2_/TRDRNA2_169368_c6_seq1.p2 gnl/TRDRNA2_/TRDRNA2_169368_c6~~gnl/TRDRNA2_/TRDRNA2_169368_c6_seq1.p2  ORF type:complete len:102 (+),score=8.28 gnl/TRDRNA2_/TRDRNA2_169368_c6_seq1:31-336(+)